MGQGIHGVSAFLGVGYHATSLTDLRQTKVARTLFNRAHNIEVVHAQGEEFNGTTGKADPEGVALGDYDVRCRGVLEGTPEGVIVPLARSLLGGSIGSSVVGTTGQQHLVLLANQLPLAGGRLSCEVRKGTNAQSELFNAVCDMLEFQITQAGYARWAFSLIGSSPEVTASPTAPTFPAMTSMLSKRVTTLTFGGSTAKILRGLSWRLKRKFVEDDYDTTSRQRRDASPGEMEATVDAELTYQNEDELKQFWGGTSETDPTDTDVQFDCNIKTERSDVIAGGTAKQTIALDLPKFQITRVGTPIQGREVIRQRLQGRAIYNAAGTYAQQFKAINTIAAY